MEALLLTIPSYAPLAARLAAEAGLAQGEVERRTFPDGERYQRLACDVRDRDVVLLAGTPGDLETLEAYDLACAIVRSGAARLTWLCPYFGYQTMERATRPGEVVVAKTRARLISAVPAPPGGLRVVLCDLHAPGIPHYFGDAVTAYHLYAKRLACEGARALAGDGFVLAAPDAGRVAWVSSLARDLGVPCVFATKRRLSGEQVEHTGVHAAEGGIAGKTVVIYDDMIRTGGTLLEAARAFRAQGATRVLAVATHLVLPGDALARLLVDGAIDAVAGTDTHPRARALEGPHLAVRSVAPLLAAWLRGDDLELAPR